VNIFTFVCGYQQQASETFKKVARSGFEKLFVQEIDSPMQKIIETDLSGAFFLAAKVADGSPDEVHIAQDERYFLVIWGEIVGLEATAALHRLNCDGVSTLVAEARSHDGCFGVMIFDKQDRSISLFSDIVGQRTSRFVALPDGIVVVSSHDLGLAIMGVVPPVEDSLSLASITSIGWSLGNASLIDGIQACYPSELIVISGPSLLKNTSQANQVDIYQIQNTSTTTDQPLHDLVVHWLGGSIESRKPIWVELSAGFDSRASLAATLAVANAEALTAFSEGPADSLDVQVAKEIAHRAGIRFEHRETPMQTPEAFVFEWSRTAAATNGNIDISVLASRKSAPRSEAPPVSICGDGGEIYRGHFYPYRPFSRVAGHLKCSAEHTLALKLLASLPEALRSGLRLRLDNVAARLRFESSSETEVLDRFYAMERFGIWNQKLVRDPAARNRHSPFYSRRAMQAGFGMPTPMGWTNGLHVELISRHLPKALDLPINGEASAQRHRRGLVNKLVLEISMLSGKISRQLRKRLGQPMVNLEMARNMVITNLAAGIIADTRSFLPSAGSEYSGSAENILARISAYGRSSWQELGALRFLRIYQNLYENAKSCSTENT
jgi:hypothetical protein